MVRRIRNLNRAFGQVLRQHRSEAGISQENLAYECDLHRTYISMLERGLKSPSLDTLCKLAAALDLRPHQLVKEAEELRRVAGKNPGSLLLHLATQGVIWVCESKNLARPSAS